MDIASCRNGTAMKRNVAMVGSLALTAVRQAHELSIARSADWTMRWRIFSIGQRKNVTGDQADFVVNSICELARASFGNRWETGR